LNSSVDIRDIKWSGDAPVFLVHRRWRRWRRKETFFKENGKPYKKWVVYKKLRTNIIDLNERGWIDRRGYLLKFSGVLMLCAKERINTTGIRLPLASVSIGPGEVAFCYRHVVSLVYISTTVHNSKSRHTFWARKDREVGMAWLSFLMVWLSRFPTWIGLVTSSTRVTSRRGPGSTAS